jgi:hypothetical protein
MPSVLRDALFGAFVLGVGAGNARADAVLIYRCVDAAGAVAFQDSPCPKDAHQDVRQMLRPRDAASHSEPVAATQPAPHAPQQSAPRDPRPLYQCTTPDGDTYLSQNGIPQGRYVPLWTTGAAYSGAIGGSGARGRAQQINGPGQFRAGMSAQAGPSPYGPVTYVEDTCERMPQNDVCQTLQDRDSDLGTQIFNAQPDERVVYEREQKSVRTQMRNDCGAN